MKKNATELHVTANLDIGRKCSVSLQFISRCRRRVQAFYKKAMPCFCLGLNISEKKTYIFTEKKIRLIIKSLNKMWEYHLKRGFIYLVKLPGMIYFCPVFILWLAARLCQIKPKLIHFRTWRVKVISTHTL